MIAKKKADCVLCVIKKKGKIPRTGYKETHTSLLSVKTGYVEYNVFNVDSEI